MPTLIVSVKTAVIRLLVGLAAWLWLGQFAFAQPSDIRLAWVADFRLENHEVEMLGAARGMRRDDPTWLLIGKRPRGKLGGVLEEIALWRIDAAGVRQREVLLRDIAGLLRGRLAPNGFVGLEVLQDGLLRLILAEADDSISVATLESDGSTLKSATRIDGGRQGLSLVRVRPNAARPDQLQLLGSANGRGKLQPVFGSPASQALELGIGGVDALIDVANSGAHRYLAGLSLRSGGETDVLLFHQKVEGGEVAPPDIKLVARNAQMAAALPGGDLVGVAFDRPGSTGWTVGLNAYDADLQLLWSKTLFEELRVFHPFQVAAFGRDQLLVTGGDGNFRMWSQLFDRQGAHLWSLQSVYAWPDNDIVTKYGILLSGNGFYLAATVLAVAPAADGRLEQRQLIRLWRLDGRQ